MRDVWGWLVYWGPQLIGGAIVVAALGLVYLNRLRIERTTVACPTCHGFGRIDKEALP